jgi:hypothetical protein
MIEHLQATEAVCFEKLEHVMLRTRPQSCTLPRRGILSCVVGSIFAATGATLER